MGAAHRENSIRFSDLPDEALVRLPMALAVTGWKKTRFYQGMGAGEIPQSVRLGERARAWRVGDLRAFLRRLGAQAVASEQ